MNNVLSNFHHVTTFIFDVDGVFTDSSLFVTEEGQLLRTMNARDGYAVRHAVDNGYQVIIITGGTSKGVEMRLKGLGVEHVFIAIKDKLALYNKLVTDGIIVPEATIYMGDDIPDLEVMKAVRYTACPSDAAHEILDMSQYVSPKEGGNGAVRDLIESVLRLQNNWI